MSNFLFQQPKGKIHFVGIAGVSMSGLARYVARLGYRVTGSDKNLSDYAETFKAENIIVYNGHNQKNVVGADVVVYSSAISDDNVELIYASLNNIPVIKRSELLGLIIKEYKNSVAISGSHGKTTATAMLWEVLKCAHIDPVVFLGGDYKSMTNFNYSESDYLIAEACEYKQNFLDLSPKISVVLNIDNDHLDSFGNIDKEIDAFNQFIDGNISLINIDDKNVRQLHSECSISFAIKNKAVFMAKYLRKIKTGYSFSFFAYNTFIGRLKLNVDGVHNVYNALSVAGVAMVLGIPFEKVQRGLALFENVKRRNELIGEYLTANEGKRIKFIADYAHHPTEIKAILSTVNDRYKKPIIVFQPHTYSRTKILMKNFVDLFCKLENLIIYKTYPARENFDIEGDGKTLRQKLNAIEANKVLYADNENELYALIKERMETIDSVVFLGAGDIYQIAKKCFNRLSSDSRESF